MATSPEAASAIGRAAVTAARKVLDASDDPAELVEIAYAALGDLNDIAEMWRSIDPDVQFEPAVILAAGLLEVFKSVHGYKPLNVSTRAYLDRLIAQMGPVRE